MEVLTDELLLISFSMGWIGMFAKVPGSCGCLAFANEGFFGL